MDNDAEFCWPPAGASLPTNSSSAPMLLTPPMNTRRTPQDNRVTPHRTDSVTYSRLQPQGTEFQTVLDESTSSRTLQDSQVTPHRNSMTYMRLPSHGGISQTAEFQRVDEQQSDEFSRAENMHGMLSAVLKSQQQLQQQMGELIQRVSALENTPPSSSSSDSSQRKKRLPSELCVSIFQNFALYDALLNKFTE